MKISRVVGLSGPGCDRSLVLGVVFSSAVSPATAAVQCMRLWAPSRDLSIVFLGDTYRSGPPWEGLITVIL